MSGERERLRDVLRVHHPIMRSETGPFSGCRCGQVRLGQDVIAHVVAHLADAHADLLDEIAADVRARFEWGAGYGKQLRDRAAALREQP